jgi:hypothetical protein
MLLLLLELIMPADRFLLTYVLLALKKLSTVTDILCCVLSPLVPHTAFVTDR